MTDFEEMLRPTPWDHPAEHLGLRTLTDRGLLQSAVTTFRNLDGRTVTLIAVEPVGMPQYYAQLRDVVDVLTAAGALVRKEHVREAVDESQARDDTEAAALRAMATDFSARAEVLSTYGLDWVGRPGSVMANGAGWLLSDVEPIDLLRLFGTHAFLGLLLNPANSPIDDLRNLVAQGNREQLTRKREQYVNAVIGRGQVLARGPMFPGRREQSVMYAWRHCEEMRKVLRDTRDTVLVWGTDHMLGLTEILVRNAFTLFDTQWFDVATKPAPDLPFPMDRQC